MKDDSVLVHAGRDPLQNFGIVNPPVYRASTVLFPSVDAFRHRARGERRYRGVRYGALGTPTTFALADAVAQLEGGQGTVVVSSGLAAVTLALTALLSKGDHLLMADCVYGPTREFCDTILNRFGVQTTYYDPLMGADIATLLQPNTRVVFTESPGSMTFEVQDIPAIAAVAHAHDIMVIMDNTWATPLFFKPFDHGVDLSIQAGTKYIAGHSDLVIGLITARSERLFRQVKEIVNGFGDIAGPEECYLTLRGMRSMGARLRQQQAAVMEIVRWLQRRGEVKRVLYPPLAGDPGHRIWRRDFSGASSLFGLVLDTPSQTAVDQMVDGYRFFKIGASWGGFESLVIPANPRRIRTAVPWTETGMVLRYHVGLEDVGDLIADLDDGFQRLRSALGQR